MTVRFWKHCFLGITEHGNLKRICLPSASEAEILGTCGTAAFQEITGRTNEDIIDVAKRTCNQRAGLNERDHMLG